MADFKPAFPYTTALELLIPTYSTDKGVKVKTYPEAGKGIRLNGSFRTFGGTETVVNGTYMVLDTASIETWYRPDIKADCRIRVIDTGKVYEMACEPEDISLRHQFCKCRVRLFEGGA